MSKQLKDFNELTEAGQKARLKKYQEEKEALGLKNVLANLVNDVKIADNKDGSKSAYMRLAINEKDGSTWFMSASAYIAEGKDALEDFYRNGIKKGHLVDVDYKTNVKGNRTFNNIYNLMSREKAYRRNLAKAKAESKQEPKQKQPAQAQEQAPDTVSMN